MFVLVLYFSLVSPGSFNRESTPLTYEQCIAEADKYARAGIPATCKRVQGAT